MVALSPQQSKKAKFSPFSRWQALWLRHVIGFIPLGFQEKTSSISCKHNQKQKARKHLLPRLFSCGQTQIRLFPLLNASQPQKNLQEGFNRDDSAPFTRPTFPVPHQKNRLCSSLRLIKRKALLSFMVVLSPQCGENTAFFSSFPLGWIH